MAGLVVMSTVHAGSARNLSGYQTNQKLAANRGRRRTSGYVQPSLVAGFLGRKSAFHRFWERKHFVGYVIVGN